MDVAGLPQEAAPIATTEAGSKQFRNSHPWKRACGFHLYNVEASCDFAALLGHPEQREGVPAPFILLELWRKWSGEGYMK